MPSYHWPPRAECGAGCPQDNGRRPHYTPPTGRQPSPGGKGDVCPSLLQNTLGDCAPPAYGPLVLAKRRTLMGKFLGSCHGAARPSRRQHAAAQRQATVL